MTILLLSGLIPFLYHFETATTPIDPGTPAIGDYEPIVLNIDTVAGEPNYTRDSWPFIIDNYPNFTWKNPGKFNGSQTTAGAIIWTANREVKGYQQSLPYVGTGKEKYRSLYNSISGLNESNIRILYLDADYNWISVPYQVDQRGWVNVWNIGDLNKWAGLGVTGAGNAGSTGTSGIFSNGGGEHQVADMTTGLGWVAGDMGNSEGMSNYGTWTGGAGANNLQCEWYRIPIWSYVSPRQPDGKVSNEMLVIDPEYRDNLIWCYTNNATFQPHKAWLAGDRGGSTPFTNYWNWNTNGTPSGGNNARNNNPYYPMMNARGAATSGARPAFVNTTDEYRPWTENQTGTNNMVFMGDTWFTTPGDYATTAGGKTMPQWVRNQYPYVQINGAVDKDDQLCFYVYNGRQAPGYLWWNYSYFPQRYEMAIVDPVDGGRTWMYIYYNNKSAYNPVTNASAVNLGAPKFTTTDANGNPISWYVTWDPSTQSIVTDFYRTNMNLTLANTVAGLQMMGNTDGVSILESFSKMYLSGHVTMAQGGITVVDTALSFGRQGLWYRWPGTTPVTANHNEILATLDNPSVWYPGIPTDNSIMIQYKGDRVAPYQYTADRRTTATTSPQNYYGPRGVALGHTPPMQTWAQTTGDQRAIANGPCRVIFYYQSFIMLGVYLYGELSGTAVLDDDVDIVFPIMDGPQMYYRRMQLQPEMSVEIPSLSGATIQIYYAYIECGEINPAVRNDLNITAAVEWSGKSDGIDNGVPRFGWNNLYGYSKIGGLDPKTTTCTLLGYSDFVPAHNLTNYYKSGGNPLIEGDPVTYPAATPQGTNNFKLCDWAMVTSETHGSVWLYIPRREANESRDNNARAGITGQLKMYFRDDGGPNSHPGFGICLDGGASPWIQGGTETSPFRLMMVFGETKQKDALAVGHRLYVNYFHPLESSTSFSGSVAPSPRFMFSTAQPDKLVYKTGEKVNILVTGCLSTGDSFTTTIYVNGRNIHTTDPTMAQMTNRGDGSFNFTYTIDAVSSYAAPAVTRYINLTAKVNTVIPGWVLSTYLLNITIDNTPPAPTGQLATLTSPTTEASVYLSWAAVPGYDKGSASFANPSGLGGYILQRGIASGIYDTNLTSLVPITTTSFLDTFLENGKTYYYRLLTYDAVGNVNASAQRQTTINLPYTPAQPAELPATKNNYTNPMVIDWTANPGYGSGVTITGYHVFRSISIASGYTDISGQLGSAVRTYTDPGKAGGLLEATTYYYKVLTDTASQNLYSAPVFTKIDRVKPAPAELATPLPTYRSVEQEILVSWSILTLPEYQTGGFPGQDLNGIKHWIISKKIGDAGAWVNISTIPYSPLAEDQIYRDVAVQNKTKYWYRIYTVDDAGNTAKCTFDQYTTLFVTGPGKAEPYTVTAGYSDVKQGALQIPVTVMVRNPGMAQCVVNEVKLYMHFWNVTEEANVTSNYLGTVKTDGTVLAKYSNRTYTFNVNVSTTAALGTVTVDALTRYNSTKYIIGASYTDSWVVTPDASLSVDTVTSTKSIVNPGMKDIPVTIKVDNPGKSNAVVETIQLTFIQNSLDISNKFLVEEITNLPTNGFNRSSKFIVVNVTVGQSVTAGGVTVNALVSGKSYGIILSDTDGAITPLTWAVQTSARPVIASVVADKEVYWSSSVIRLTVTCDKAGHTVRGFFGPLDGSTSNETATDNGDHTYTITHTMGTAVGENTYTATVYATNASGAVKQTLGIRLGNAPTFSGWVQAPTDGNVEYNMMVDIDIEITDNSGAQYVQAYLKYRIEGGSWNIQPMSHASGTHWDVIIPAQMMGGLVEYVINATDAAGNWALYSKSYTVNPAPTTPIWVSGSQSAHNAGNTVTYTESTPAPLNTNIYYTATITTSFQEAPGANYYVIVSAVDAVHHAEVSINSTVYLTNPSAPIVVTLYLNFASTKYASGSLITGQIYICTGLPETGGRTLAWVSFTHQVA